MSIASTHSPPTNVQFVRYENEAQLPGIQQVVGSSLSEPYPIFTYRYFLVHWPQHCYLALDATNQCIGAIICRLQPHKNTLGFQMDRGAQSDGEKFDSKLAVRSVNGVLVPSALMRGYIAMVAVNPKYRKQGIGSRLVCLAIESMLQEKANEIVLETEATNLQAIHFYQRLGFIKEKRLHRYYLNGVDAFRLKLRAPV
ncbi:N-alpha-acetyltransferase 30 [Dimargaris xerosporica]|nr:N-alpha-acetyltransferase 30 [Dimargaris xerosporica]